MTVTDRGGLYLGNAIGTEEFKRAYVQDMVSGWTDTVQRLSAFAKSQPYAAYACFSQCIQRRWDFSQRICDAEGDDFKPLEDAIRQVLIPTLFGSEISDNLRDVLTLPVRVAGLSFENPASTTRNNFSSSRQICTTMTTHITEQRDIQSDITSEMNQTRNAIKSLTRGIVTVRQPFSQKRRVSMAYGAFFYSRQRMPHKV